MQLIRQIFFRAREREEEPAVATAAGVASYRALSMSVLSAVQVIEDLHIPSGAFVLIDVAQPLHHCYLLFALALLGYPSASLDQLGGIPENGPRASLILSDRVTPPEGSIERRQISESWFAFDRRIATDYVRLLALPGFDSPDDIMRYIYSSGTTGRPKCVAYTVQLLDNRVRNSVFIMSNVERPAGGTMNLMGINTMPAMMSLLRTLVRGGVVCFASDTAAAIEMIRLFRIEYLSAAVGQLQLLLGSLRGRTAPTSLQTLFVTGAKLPLGLLTEARAKLCPNVIFAYGSTEASTIAVGTGAVLEAVEGSVGYVVPGVSVEIVDGSGSSVAAGTEGTLRVRPIDAPFYVNMDGTREEILAGGWYSPGDIGKLDAGGLLILTGRTTDVINIGGVIVAPEGIEEVFRRNAEVVDVAAVRVSQPSGSDQVWLAIVGKSELDLASIVRVAAMTLGERTPTRWFQLVEIPRNENQKIKRDELRQQLVTLARKA